MKLPILLFVILLISSVSAQSCVTSSEDYAVEAVVPSYTLFNIAGLGDRNSEGYVLSSQYDSRIYSIVKETEFPEGLSIRLQIPTKAIETKSPNIKFVSTSATGSLRETQLASFGEWRVSCIDSGCEFTKPDRTVSVTQGEVSIEIRSQLPECTPACSGVCFSTTVSSKCIDQKTKNDFNTLLRFFGVTNNFEDLLESYRITGSEEISLQDIQPEISPYINWQEALRQELVFLSGQEVIQVTRNDIESIAALAKKGQAGQNYRIVYDFKNETWTYYDKTESPQLTSVRDCKEYTLVEERPSSIPINSFYLVPLIISVAGLVVILGLAIIARVISKRKS